MEDEKQREIQTGGFLKGFFSSFLMAISLMIFTPIITSILAPMFDIFGDIFGRILIMILAILSPYCMFFHSIIIGIIKWRKHKEENRKLALGYLIGSFMHIIILLVMMGSCGLMYINP